MSGMHGHAVDRELLLVAYEKVTPPRNPQERDLREKLLAGARAILYPGRQKQLVLRGFAT
jgi:hypothetical protein